jgi:hypothetical protein
MIDILTFIATSVLAAAAIRISLQANMTAERAVSVEVDKHIFEWAQRCLNCASRISSLRLLPENKMDDTAFEEERRVLYAELFALKNEGTLFFETSQSKASTPCIMSLEDTLKLVTHDAFCPPKKGDFDSRKATNNSIRGHIRAFSAAIQSRVGSQWANN